MTFLGIEIGGTKLQLGVGTGNGKPLNELQRFDVDPNLGAKGILRHIEAAAKQLIDKHAVTDIGIGFGGPVDAVRGIVIKSHQIEGWAAFPLVQWCQETLQRKTFLHNDCDAAALAEARLGAGRGQQVVLFVTVGTGVGGGLVIDGAIYRGGGVASAEIGHLRPGLEAPSADQTVESIASGWAIASAARARVTEVAARDPSQGAGSGDQVEQRFAEELRSRCDGNLDALTAKDVALAATTGNGIARCIIDNACRCLGWGIAQVATVVGPNVVVVGGGVSLMDKRLFLSPLKVAVDRYVFPPLIGKFEVLPAELGEDVVVHGAIAIANNSH